MEYGNECLGRITFRKFFSNCRTRGLWRSAQPPGVKFCRSPDSTFSIAVAGVMDGRVRRSQRKIFVIFSAYGPTLEYTLSICPGVKWEVANKVDIPSIISSTSYYSRGQGSHNSNNLYSYIIYFLTNIALRHYIIINIIIIIIIVIIIYSESLTLQCGRHPTGTVRMESFSKCSFPILICLDGTEKFSHWYENSTLLRNYCV
jgi:hypothetical protein